MFLFFSYLLFAEEDPMEIIVEGHEAVEIYVSDIKVTSKVKDVEIEFEVDKTSSFSYSSMYSRYAKIANEYGIFEPIDIDINVYNSETIVYAWEDCDYKKEPLKCSVANSHYYLATEVFVDDNELVVKSMLYDYNAQVISLGVSKDRKIITWIKQQEISSSQNLFGTSNISGLPQRNCDQSSCSLGNQNRTVPITQTTINKPKEEMPLRFSIPHMLLDKHIQQSLMLMWVGVKIK